MGKKRWDYELPELALLQKELKRERYRRRFRRLLRLLRRLLLYLP